jgi:hypothetical protein
MMLKYFGYFKQNTLIIARQMFVILTNRAKCNV